MYEGGKGSGLVTNIELKALLDEKVNRDDFFDMRTQFNKMN